jgi:hypothetical protein
LKYQFCSRPEISARLRLPYEAAFVLNASI